MTHVSFSDPSPAADEWAGEAARHARPAPARDAAQVRVSACRGAEQRSAFCKVVLDYLPGNCVIYKACSDKTRQRIKAQLYSSELRGGHGQAQDRGAGEEDQQEAGGHHDRGRDRPRAGPHYLVLPIYYLYCLNARQTSKRCFTRPWLPWDDR